MKKRYLLVLLLFFPRAYAGSVGISPAFYSEHFEPNLEKRFSFNTFNSNSSEGIGISLEGDLVNYSTLDENYILGSGIFYVKLKLPKELERPGVHTLYVRVFESKNISNVGGVGGVASVRAPIIILVPYPGKYAESRFNVNNINEGQKTAYELEIRNLGTENLRINAKIEVYDSEKKILTKEIDEISIKTKEVTTVNDFLETSDLAPGEYYATATLEYGKTDLLNSSFKIGQFLIEVRDYDYQFETGKINRFNIEVENKWNAKIDSIYAEVTISDEGKVVTSFKTISIDTPPWEIKNLTGFIDATNLESKRHIANINLFYANTSSNKLVAIYINDPPKKDSYFVYAIIGATMLGLLILICFTVLVLKIKKLNKLLRKNGRKK
jgi:hypothetical protein